MNFRAQLQDLEFFRQFADQGFESLAHTGGFDQFLAQQCRKRRQRAGDEVRQAARMVDVHRRSLQVVGKLRRVADHLAEKILRITLQSFEFCVRFADDVRLRLHASLQKRTQAN